MTGARPAARRRWATRPRTILLAGHALFLLYAFPGFMSVDSVIQLREARAGVYSDWHPPVMAALWRLVEVVVAGPLGMLLIQSLLFLFGLHRLLRRGLPERTAAILAVAVLLLPPVMTPMAVIWKDSQMAGFLMMGAALIVEPRRGLRLLGLGLIAAATAMRYNAAAASLPIVVGGAAAWPGLRGWRRPAVALAAWAATVAVALGASYRLTTLHVQPWHSSVALLDIAGTLRGGPPTSDAELRAILDGTPLVAGADLDRRIRAAYSPRTYWLLDHGDQRVFDPPTTAAQRAAIARDWWRLVRAHPGAYLAHRWAVFRELLGLSDQPLWAPVDAAITPGPRYARMITHVATFSRLQRAIAGRFEAWAVDTPLFEPYMYLMLALCLVPLAWRQRDLLALLLSGLAYEASYVLFAPSPDYRYSHWMITCAVVAAVALAARRAAVGFRARREAAA